MISANLGLWTQSPKQAVLLVRARSGTVARRGSDRFEKEKLKQMSVAFWPGKSQTCGRAARHQSRKSSSSWGESIT
jgi:hypothetical protein